MFRSAAKQKRTVCRSNADLMGAVPASLRRFPRLTCACATIDQVLRGGLPCGAITEISGAASCGKTQVLSAFVFNFATLPNLCLCRYACNYCWPLSFLTSLVGLAEAQFISAQRAVCRRLVCNSWLSSTQRCTPISSRMGISTHANIFC